MSSTGVSSSAVCILKRDGLSAPCNRQNTAFVS